MRAAAGYRALSVAIVAVSALSALAGFTLLVVHDPAADLYEFLPGEDGRPADLPPPPAVRINDGFETFDGVASAIAASWPGFRGPRRDNRSRETVPLAVPAARVAAGSNSGPSRTSAKAIAGAAVANGVVYVLDYDEERLADTLRCFSLDDGREIWRRWYRVSLKRDHGISRTVPAVAGRYVVTLGPAGQLMCCDALTGEFRWGIDLVADFGTIRPRWYAGQCPLIDGDQAVIAACGPEVLLMGVDLATGRVAWRTPNPRRLEMSHSSIVTTTIDGVRMYVYAAVNGIAGVSADPVDRGELLWDARGLDVTVIAPSPVPLDDGMIFFTAGYGGGSMLLRVGRSGGAFTSEELGRWPAEEGFSSEQQTPVVLDGRLVGIIPDAGGPRRGQLACWDPATTTWAWLSGQDRRFGQYGPFLVADGKLLILDQDGTLTIAEASTEAYRPLGSAKILEGPDAWAPMALVDGRLIARDTNRMVCLDLRRDR